MTRLARLALLALAVLAVLSQWWWCQLAPGAGKARA